MKTLFTLLTTIIFGTAFAQKFDREYFTYQHSNLPEKLIYDQIKTYAFNYTTSGEFLPFDAISKNTLGLSGYEQVGFANADLQVQVNYGPFQLVEEKTNVSTRQEEVNKVKVNVNYYSRVLSFRFPIAYRGVNAKNRVAIWSADLSNQTVHTIQSPEYRTETEAFNYINSNRAATITAKTTELVNSFTGNNNAYFKRSIDFYPTRGNLDIYKFKKWKQDDEYNAHIKNVMKIFETTTYDEKPANTEAKLKADIDYMASFEGKFDPLDKDDDILYWGNYYNLATIYYCLDNCDKADYYLTKLDSSKKQTDNTKGLKSDVSKLRQKLAKHYLTDRHFTYNPVKDYRLAGKTIQSDAASAAENAVGALASGKVEAKDKIINLEGKEIAGKVVHDAAKGIIQFIPKDDPAKIETLSPVNVLGFSIDTVNYIMCKNLSNATNPVKQFFKVVFNGAKIKLLMYVEGNLVPRQDYIAVIRPKEDGVFFVTGFGIKKRLAKYFEDCKEVSDKAGDGDYGKALTVSVNKFIEMCQDYEACK